MTCKSSFSGLLGNIFSVTFSQFSQRMAPTSDRVDKRSLRKSDPHKIKSTQRTSHSREVGLQRLVEKVSEHRNPSELIHDSLHESAGCSQAISIMGKDRSLNTMEGGSEGSQELERRKNKETKPRMGRARRKRGELEEIARKDQENDQRIASLEKKLAELESMSYKNASSKRKRKSGSRNDDEGYWGPGFNSENRKVDCTGDMELLGSSWNEF